MRTGWNPSTTKMMSSPMDVMDLAVKNYRLDPDTVRQDDEKRVGRGGTRPLRKKRQDD